MNSSADILADWKNQRFVVADNIIIGYSEIVIILCDITFWNNNYNALAEWCDAHGVKLAGMTVELDTQEQLTLFCLRWA